MEAEEARARGGVLRTRMDAFRAVLNDRVAVVGRPLESFRQD